MEETETVIEAPATQDQGSDFGYSDVLKGDEATPKDGTQPGNEPEKEQPPQTAESLFAELLISESQKLPFKTKDEFDSFIERNKPLKDGVLRLEDYTRKTQELSRERKLYEEAFGYKPAREEIMALRPVIQDYARDPDWQKIIDMKIRGAKGADILRELSGNVGTPQDKTGPVDPNTQALMREIQSLKGELTSMRHAQEEQVTEVQMRENKRSFDSWLGKRQQAEKDFLWNEDIDYEMGYIIPSLLKKNPDWDNNKILDESHLRAVKILHPERETQRTVQKTLISEEEAKKKNPPKIQSSPSKVDESKSGYGALIFGQR